jgi:chromosome segregation ATPase
MAATSPLPTNWIVVLEQIQQTLTKASQLAQARETALAEVPVAQASVLSPDNLAKHLEELTKRVQTMAAPLSAFDQTLQSEEKDARRHLAQVADLRQRLADWAGRAVG